MTNEVDSFIHPYLGGSPQLVIALVNFIFCNVWYSLQYYFFNPYSLHKQNVGSSFIFSYVYFS